MSAAARAEMGCEELVELVTAYLDGALSAQDAERFESHLAECDGCEMYVEQFRETVAALGHLPPESLTPASERSLLSAFRDWRSRR